MGRDRGEGETRRGERATAANANANRRGAESVSSIGVHNKPLRGTNQRRCRHRERIISIVMRESNRFRLIVLREIKSENF